MPDLPPPRPSVLRLASPLRTVSALAGPVLAVPLLAMLALTGCVGAEAHYPSVAQRPVEREFDQTIPQAPAPPAAALPDAGLVQQATALRAEAVQADARFAERADEARRLVAAAHGSAPGSESWSKASVALASLDSARSDTALALGSLDALRIRAGVAAADSNSAAAQAGYAAVSEADSAFATVLGNEDAQIDMMRKAVDR